VGVNRFQSDDIQAVVGGTIPVGDVPKLQELGVADSYATSTKLLTLVESLGVLTGAGSCA
jgi:methylmalonyl-CoA mutase C-terminal domain/subunit